MKIIVTGNAVAKITKTKDPINFLGAIEKETGNVRDKKYDLFGRTIANSILVFPYGVGSSVGAYTIYALRSHRVAPAAMVCQKADLTVSSGCAMANIPLLVANKDEYNALKDDCTISIDTKNNPPIKFY
ncbi:MAG: hypothetical protein K8823_250 [Cenarchaeum symbiont of Oopsacas minuta]|nr:hypothetical protein [Cenarchaeum symbiont of Oopsacas minuta]